MDRSDPAYRGQSDYTPLLLNLYDPLVLGPIARFIWRCPTSELLQKYRARIRPNHLDVGPGTGYFVANAGLPARSPVTVVDPNPNVLRHVAARLPGLDVTTVEADVLKPLPVSGPYDSAALHLVLHCLPGPLERKAAAVANVERVLSPEGILFGATVLGRSGRHNAVARRVLAAFNARGAFDNLDDTEAGVRSILDASFRDVRLETIGSIAIFAATGRR